MPDQTEKSFYMKMIVRSFSWFCSSEAYLLLAELLSFLHFL